MVPLPIIIDGLLRLGELAQRLIASGRAEATPEEMDAATARAKGSLASLEAAIAAKKAGRP